MQSDGKTLLQGEIYLGIEEPCGLALDSHTSLFYFTHLRRKSKSSKKPTIFTLKISCLKTIVQLTLCLCKKQKSSHAQQDSLSPCRLNCLLPPDSGFHSLVTTSSSYPLHIIKGNLGVFPCSLQGSRKKKNTFVQLSQNKSIEPNP